jgi:spore maturation protein CgeB
LGLAVDVYGTGWEAFLPPGYLKGKHIPNQILRRYYSRCGVLLNDHWETMSQKGFISNRLFDASACGATIVSDHVFGLKEVFGDDIVVYNNAQELPHLVRECLQRREQNHHRRVKLAHKVRESHTFEQRVHEIMNVIEMLSGSGSGLKDCADRRATLRDSSVVGSFPAPDGQWTP